MNSSKKQTLFQLVPCMYFLCSILLSCSVTLKERKRPLYNPYYSNTKKSLARLPQIRPQQSLFFFFVRRAKRPRHTKDQARNWRCETGEAAALVSHVLRLRRSRLECAYTPPTKSEEKESACSLAPNISFNQSANCTLGFYKQFSSKVV